MVVATPEPAIRKTVALHPAMDQLLRRTWAIMIEDGLDATYSTAMNYLLLAAFTEIGSETGPSRDALSALGDFMADRETIDRLNLQDHVFSLKGLWDTNT